MYNTKDSPVVTDPTTDLALSGLSRGERTGSRVFQRLHYTHEIQTRTLLCVVCGNPTSIEEILRWTSVAARMSWCAARETTRDEDRAYSLLGLFGVNMPLLYGEGGDAAWVRLLEEIIQKTNDQSILAFDSRPRREERAPQSFSTAPSPFRSGIFSEHASRYASPIYLPTSLSTSRMKLVAGDLVLDIWLCPLFLKDAKSSSRQRAWDDLYIGLLYCRIGGHGLAWPALMLQPVTKSNREFIRMKASTTGCPQAIRGDGVSIEGIPILWHTGYQVMGMAVFGDNKRPPFMVVWGSKEKEGNWRWCKLSPLSQTDYYSHRFDLAEVLRSFDIARDRLRHKDALAFGDIYLAAEIEEVKILDREIWQLRMDLAASA
ncbi:hypothetical protein E0Z10_g342 [Xylaria hypoxylon]|uniref:Heterokaryon incompatibility domain-containing protein n=1 Tax=Xylaria hypoxylon TaxID=37992 RepID=A0A4Z0YVI1_9PEZI|nr:hypothetical protein E0Z10_g342 [Xylaria hypoxylon]